MRKVIIALSFLLIITSCNSKRAEPEQVDSNTVAGNTAPVQTPVAPMVPITKKGVVVENVPVYGDAANTFSAYEPLKYDSTKPAPLIVFADPLGNSVLLLDKYKSLAEKFGYIMVASNAAFNKTNSLSGVLIMNNLLADAEKRFNPDKSRIIYAGLGSGAKIAIDAACGNKDVTAVVYTGGVLLWSSLAHPVSFLCFAGKKDMNYSELLSFNDSKYLKDKDHYVIAWNGGQEWPDAKTFEAAFLYPYNKIPAQQLLVIDANMRIQLDSEKQLRQQYCDALLQKDGNWWKTEVTNINRKAQTDDTYERLKSLLSLYCYNLGAQYLTKNDLVNAEKIVTAYKLISPGNPDCAKMEEELSRRKGK